MFMVYFYENKNLILCQLLKSAPDVGEKLKIKGRKGKASNIVIMNDKKIHVQVEWEEVPSRKLPANTPKKKRS